MPKGRVGGLAHKRDDLLDREVAIFLAHISYPWVLFRLGIFTLFEVYVTV